MKIQSCNIKTDNYPNKSLHKYLEQFNLNSESELFQTEVAKKTVAEKLLISNCIVSVFINEFWTAQQRQSNSIHEISYRACFKAQLPRFFIDLLTDEEDLVYDPFSGRGTTIIEAALMNRNVISNDINPLSKILTEPRLNIPSINDVKKRLESINFYSNLKAEIDISMFYHPNTESEIVSLKKYLCERKISGKEDFIDRWIRMVATNRLTGHSKNFFSIYTLPPNQAISPERQKKFNIQSGQQAEYKNIKDIILIKSRNLLKDIDQQKIKDLSKIAKEGIFLSKDARKSKDIKDETVNLIVTSPPFLDVIQYADDNWLRCWFNDIDINDMKEKITVLKKLEDWTSFMRETFKEFYRIVKTGGWVAFEVGEVKNGKIKLDEVVVPIGIDAGFSCEGVMINSQIFSKTSNCWGVSNNTKGTNTNRIVIFKKG